MPSLLSLSKFAKHNSLHSFTSHSLADLSNLASAPGEEMLSQGIDAKGRGQEGKPNAPGQHFPCQGQAARSPHGELGSDWGARLTPQGCRIRLGISQLLLPAEAIRRRRGMRGTSIHMGCS